jgi:NitT/TauT family transport system permease protein
MSRLAQIALSIVTALLAWEAVALLAGALIVPTPLQTLRAGAGLFADGELPAAIGQTLAIYAGGLSLAAFAGIAAGLAMGGFPLLGRLFEPWMQALAATPRIAFVPLIIVALGVGFKAKLVIVFLGAVIPVLVSTHAGVASADPELVEMACASGANRRQIFTRVLLPGALPFIMAGLRIGATTGLVNAVVAELYTAIQGLGGLLAIYGNSFRMAPYFAVVVVLAAIGLAVTRALNMAERRLTRWRAAQQEGVR